MSGGIIALIVILSVLAIALALFFILVPAKSYFTAMFSGAYVSARKLMTMRFRKMPVFDMVNAYIKGKRGKVTVTINDIENMYAIKCDYNKVIEGFIACKNAGINYKFETIQKLYLSGKDINTFVKECLNSKVVDSQYITGVCGDLQELNVKVRLTLKVNLKNKTSKISEELIDINPEEARDIESLTEEEKTAIENNFKKIFETEDSLNSLLDPFLIPDIEVQNSSYCTKENCQDCIDGYCVCSYYDDDGIEQLIYCEDNFTLSF